MDNRPTRSHILNIPLNAAAILEGHRTRFLTLSFYSIIANIRKKTITFANYSY